MADNPYLDIIDEMLRDDSVRLRHELEGAAEREGTQDRKTQVEAVRRSKQTGESYPVARDEVEESGLDRPENQPYVQQLPTEAPTLNRRITEEGQGEVFYKDLMQYYSAEKGLRELGRNTVMGWEEGGLMHQRGLFYEKEMRGALTEMERRELSEIEARMALIAEDKSPDREDWFAGTVASGGGQMASQYLRIDPQRVAHMTALGGLVGYAMGGGPVTGPIGGVTAVAGMAAGAKAAFIAHGAEQSYRVIAGSAFASFKAIEGMDPDRAAQLARFVGVLGTVPEMAGELVSLFGLPTGGLTTRAVTGLINKAVSNPKIAKALIGGILSRPVVGLVAEGATEGLQSLIEHGTIGTEAYFDPSIGYDKDLLTAMGEAFEEAKAGAAVGFAFGSGSQLVKTTSAKLQQLKEASEAVEDTDIYREDPRVAADFIDEVLGGEETQEENEVWVDAEQLKALFQADGRDNAWIEENMPEVAEDLADADQLGTQVRIKAGDFATHIMTSENYEMLREKVMQQPEDKRLVAEARELIRQQQFDKLPEERKAFEEISKEYAAKYEAGGAQPRHAAAMGMMWGSYWQAEASRQGLDPRDLAKRYHLQVEQNRAPIDDPVRMESLIGSIQKGEVFTEGDLKGPSLAEFLADKTDNTAEKQLALAQEARYVGAIDLEEFAELKKNAGVVYSPVMSNARNIRRAMEMAHLQRMAGDVGIDLTQGSPRDVVNAFRQAGLDPRDRKRYIESPPASAGLKNVSATDSTFGEASESTAETGRGRGGTLFQPVRIDAVEPGEGLFRTATGIVSRALGEGKPLQIKYYARDFSKFGSRRHDKAAWDAHVQMINDVPLPERNSAFKMYIGQQKLERMGVYNLSVGCHRNAAVLAAIEAGYIPKEAAKDLLSCHGACYKNWDPGAYSFGSVWGKMLGSARRDYKKGGERKMAGDMVEFFNRHLDLELKPIDITKIKRKGAKKEVDRPKWEKAKKTYYTLSTEAKTAMWEELKERWPKQYPSWLPQEALTVKVATPKRIRSHIMGMESKAFMDWVVHTPGKYLRGNQQGDWLNELVPDENGDTAWEAFAEAVLERWEREGHKRESFPKKLSVITAGWYADVPQEILNRVADKYGKHLLVQVTGPIDCTGAEVDFRLDGFSKLHDAGLPVVMRLVTDEWGMGGKHLNDPEAIRKTIEYITHNRIIPLQVLETPLHFDSANMKSGLSQENKAKIEALKKKGMDPQAAWDEVMGETLENMTEGIQAMFEYSDSEAQLLAVKALNHNIQYQEHIGEDPVGKRRVGLSYGRLREVGVPDAQLEQLKALGYYYKEKRLTGETVEGVFSNRCCTTGKCHSCGTQCSAELFDLIREHELKKAQEIINTLGPTDAAALNVEWMTRTGVARLLNPRNRPLFQSAMRAPIWRSAMPDVLAKKLPGKGSPKQILQLLKTWAGKPDGYKLDELEASGLIEALKEWEGKKVTKDEVMEFLAANELRLEDLEVEYDAEGDPEYDQQEVEDKARELFNEDFDYNPGEYWDDMAEDVGYEIDNAWEDSSHHIWYSLPYNRHEYIELAEDAYTEEELEEMDADDIEAEANDLFNDAAQDLEPHQIFDSNELYEIADRLYQDNWEHWEEQAREELEPETRGDTRWEEYQEEGPKEEYFEKLIVAPGRQYSEAQMELNKVQNRKDELLDSMGEMSPEEQKYRQAEMAKLLQREKDLQTTLTHGKHHETTHWPDDPNVIGHIRYSLRTDAEGNTILYIEEIQSDWHQEGRKRGYYPPKLNARMLRLGGDMAFLKVKLEKLEEAANRGADPWDTPAAAWIRDRHPSLGLPESFSLQDIRDRIAEMQAELDTSPEYKEKRAPDAPWKKTWPLLLMKRMVREAVDRGVDRIAFTTGDRQFRRWGSPLFTWEKQADGEWIVIGKEQSGGTAFDTVQDELNQKQYVDNDYVKTKHRLREIVEKIMRREKDEWTPGRWKTYIDAQTDKLWERMQTEETGQMRPRLEGMQGFYDKRLLNDINKFFGKKAWGKARVTTTRLDTYDPQNSPEVWALDINDKMRAKAHAEGMPLFQGGAGFRAYMVEDAKNAFRITLSNKGTLDSYLHESAHVFFRIQQDLYAQGLLKGDALDRFNRMLERLEVEGGKITPEVEEKFVDWFERYLRTGKAPTAGLRDLFREFKTWIIALYQRLRGKSKKLGQLPEDVKIYFDHLLATDDALMKAREERGGPIFRDQADMEGSGYKYEDYLKAYQDAENEAGEDLLSSILRENNDLDRKKFHRALGEARRMATEELAKDKAHVAAHFLRTGKMLDDSEIPEGFEGVKLNAKTVKELFHGPRDKNIIRELGGMTAAKGRDPDEVAQALGYENASALIRQVRGLKPLAQAKQIWVRLYMMNKFSPMTMSQIHDKAYAIMEGPAMEAFRQLEGKILDALHKRGGAATRATKLTRDKISLLRAVAKDEVAGKTLRELRPYKYRTAENKAGKELTAAVAKKDWTAAAVARKKQMLNQFLYREAMVAKEQGEAFRRYARKFITDAKVQKRTAKGGRHYLEAIHAILEQVDLKKITVEEAQLRKNLETYKKQIEAGELGQEVVLPKWLLEMGSVVNYKDLPVEQVRSMERAIKHLEHLSREFGKVLLNGERHDLTASALTLSTTMRSRNKGLPVSSRQNVHGMAKVRKKLRKNVAFLTKLEQLVLWMDGGEPGKAHELIFQPLAQAQHDFNDQMKIYRDRITKPLAEYLNDKTNKKRLNQEVKFYRLAEDNAGQIVRVDHYMRVHELMAAALNMFTKSNREKLLGGYGWAEGDLVELFDNHLTKEDWAMVEAILQEIHSIWPLIEKTAIAVHGMPPVKVEGIQLETRHGLLGDPDQEWGYFPVIYDKARDFRMKQYKEEELFTAAAQNGVIMPVVAHGFTEERTAYMGPMKLDLANVPRHVNDTLHFFTHALAVNGVSRLTNMGIFRRAVVETFGEEYYDLINPWLLRLANQGRTDEKGNGWLTAANYMKSGNSVIAMGLRPWTAIMQILGLFTTAHRIGAKYTTKGVRKLFDRSEYDSMYSFARDSSGEVRHLDENYDREIREAILWAIEQEGWKKVSAGVIEASFFGLQQVQRAVSTATWYGAYERHMDQNPIASHEEAVQAADSFMRMTQSSGALKDLAQIQTWNGFFQAFNLFYTYMSLAFNVLNTDFRYAVEKIGDGKPLKAGGRMIGTYWYMMLLPSLIPALIRRGSYGPRDEEDEGWLDYLLFEPLLDIMRTVPGGAFVANFIDGRRVPDTPASFYYNTFRRALSTAERKAEGEDLRIEDARTVVEGLGLVGRVPTRQMFDWYLYMHLLMQDELSNPMTGWFTRPKRKE